jgi:glutamate-1-semialdehyde 2,1-aminomutase
MDQVRFNITGTDAVQAAIRLARTYTGKSKILKFMGQYHGWIDNVLISGAATKETQMGPYESPNAVIISKGQPASVLEDVLVCHFNDLDQVAGMLQRHQGEIAAIITEPMMTNAQIITPQPGFLQGLKDLARQHESLLIYDEVVSGFRIDLRGGAGYFGVAPDITVFGKALGGGIPISCIGASREIMSVIHKDGAIHLGTYNSNPLAVAAANAVLDHLVTHEAEVYPRMKRLGLRLQNGIKEAFSRKGYPIRVQGTESLFAVMFIDQEVRNFADTFKINTGLLKKYKIELYRRGIMVRPELRDIWYLSTEHTDADIDQALTIINDITKTI